ncbi:DUF2088 domain-containing protein [Bacillus sp. ISL-47]|uniref:lactate racemase domain-containing protein n=1 Tax=Bacillus sp. ISL-47 TaxID=2819130 RepID=UPI001BE679CF|nr:lactate racemase domain-containing protein [Bacillus sp. ISL-47]MBT2689381.1 DUF2088 domain-containing protein [Bacillus sp. ISL-47]MBT2709896.1 DUF2088 domain-containing protein [Pseudomonas sp. ISL-84]
MKEYPNLIKIRQKFYAPKIENAEAETAKELNRKEISERIRPGANVAIAVGSRGIANLQTVVRTIVTKVKEAGANPFIIPAMGSHGGATDKGQEEVLHSYGITPEKVGAPICSSMEVVEIGRTRDSIPVYIDKFASEADAVIVVNRIKPHTNFKSEIESGICKMLTIGLGKHIGASHIHSFGIYGLKNLIPEMSQVLIEKMPISFGIAIIENAYDETAYIQAIEAEKLLETEKKLLLTAKELMASLPSDNIDILIVDEMGKNISGTGMDTNIIGRIYVRGQEEPDSPDIRFIGVLDLTEETNGNAIGIGYADLTTRRLTGKINFDYTYTNVITAAFPQLAKVPITLKNDRELMDVALKFVEPKKADEIRMVRIKNTLELAEIEVSEALWNELKKNDRFELLVPGPYPMVFNQDGFLMKLTSSFNLKK